MILNNVDKTPIKSNRYINKEPLYQQKFCGDVHSKTKNKTNQTKTKQNKTIKLNDKQTYLRTYSHKHLLNNMIFLAPMFNTQPPEAISAILLPGFSQMKVNVLCYKSPRFIDTKSTISLRMTSLNFKHIENIHKELVRNRDMRFSQNVRQNKKEY